MLSGTTDIDKIRALTDCIDQRFILIELFAHLIEIGNGYFRAQPDTAAVRL